MLLRFLILTCASFLVVGPCRALDNEVSWHGTWEEARTDSRLRKVPIIILIHGGDDGSVEEFSPQEISERAKWFSCFRLDLTRASEKDFKSVQRILRTEKFTVPQLACIRPDASFLLRRFHDFSSILARDLDRCRYHFNPRGAPDTLKSELAEELKELKTQLRKCRENLASRYPHKRSQAIGALVGRNDPPAVALLDMQTRRQKGAIERLEAIKAMARGRNPNHLPTLFRLLRDHSQQMRRNSILGLRRFNLVETVPRMVAQYMRESSHRNKALILRICVTLDPDNKDVRKILKSCLVSTTVLLRTHAARACLDIKPTAYEYEKLVGLARGDTSATVRKLACRIATTVAIENLPAEEADASRSRQSSNRIHRLTERKLTPGLKNLVVIDRSPPLRRYAKKCLEAIKERDPSGIESGVDAYDIDALLFQEF